MAFVSIQGAMYGLKLFFVYVRIYIYIYMGVYVCIICMGGYIDKG